MKHPVWDRILILLCALIALGCAASVVALLIGKISFDMITGWIASVDMSRFVVKAAMAGIAALFVLLFLLLFAMILPSRKKRSSNYAIQRNENGMVRISLKALETLVNKCLNQHAELKVVTSSLYSDEESIRVDVHISLQSDISMPLAISALQKQIKNTADAKKYGDSIYGIEKKQFPYMLCITNLLLHGLDVPQVFHDNTLLHDVLDYTEKDQFDVILMNPPYGGSEKKDVKNHFPDDLASSETADLFMSVIMYRLRPGGRAAVILPDGFLFGTDNAKVNIKKKLLSEFNLHTVIRMPGSVFAPYTSITTNILFFDRTGSTQETWFYRLDMPEGYKHFSKTKPMKLEHFDPAIQWWHNRQEIAADGFDKAKRFTAQQLTQELHYNLDQCGYPHEEEEILDPMDLIQRYQEERASLNAEIDRVLSQITAILGGGQG